MTITINRMGNAFYGGGCLFTPRHDFTGMDAIYPGGQFGFMPDCYFSVYLNLFSTLTWFKSGFNNGQLQ